MRWPTQQGVGADGWFDAFASPPGSTTVDYSTGINARPIAAWPEDLVGGKIGYGLGLYGDGAYGAGSGGFGYGQGPYGRGGYGFGAKWLEFVTNALADGVYTFGIIACDEAGNPLTPAAGTEATVLLAASPKPPTSVAAAAWDGAGKLTMTLGLSVDDDDA